MKFPQISNNFPLVLASASPRRKRLLAEIGIPFRPLASSVKEECTVMEPSEISAFLAEKKARSILNTEKGFWVLGADTIVAIGGKILGKPKDRENAEFMLSLLNGKEHVVITGFCILDPLGETAHKETVLTEVRFRKLTRPEIMAYIDTGEPYGKAGSYAIQRIGAFLVESIAGSYTNVVGLPVCALVKALQKVTALETFPLSR